MEKTGRIKKGWVDDVMKLKPRRFLAGWLTKIGIAARKEVGKKIKGGGKYSTLLFSNVVVKTFLELRSIDDRLIDCARHARHAY